MNISTCKSKCIVFCMKLFNKGWWNGIEEYVSCDKETLSVVNKLNMRELKIGGSYGVASGIVGREIFIKLEGDSDWQEDPWNKER